MSEIKLHSRKDPLPKGLVYALKAGEISAAVQAKLTDQAYWKKQRDEIEEAGLYRLLKCSYMWSGRHLSEWAGSQPPWVEEQIPQVVTAEVVAVPRTEIPKGAPFHDAAAAALAEAISLVATEGVPVPNSKTKGDAWFVEIQLDARTRCLKTILKDEWDGVRYRTRTFERLLEPATPAPATES